MRMELLLAKRSVTLWLVGIAALTTAVLLMRRQAATDMGPGNRPEGARYDAGL